MKFYSDWALRIATGHWTDHQSFYGLPLYAYLLGGIYRLIGYQPYLALLPQAATDALTAVLLFKLSSLAFPAKPSPSGLTFSDRHNLLGWLAALGWILFIPAQVYSTILMPTSYFVTAFWFVIWWTLKDRTSPPRLRAFLLLGVFVGFVAMMVANILFLTFFIAAGLFLRRPWQPARLADRRQVWRYRTTALCLLYGGVLAGTAPCWCHNYFVAHDPVFLSAHSGINLWIGNNPEANGYPKVPGGMRADQDGLLLDSITYAEKHAGHSLRHSEVSAYWSAQARAYITAHPVAWARLLGVKLLNFWNAYEYDDLGVIRVEHDDGLLLPGLGFGFVACLGLPGLLLAATGRPQARWVVAAVLLHMASLLTVFVTERYRMAAVPGLLLLGAFGVLEFVRALRACEWRRVGICAGLAACALAEVRIPITDPGLLFLDDYNAGVADLENNRPREAREKLSRVYNFNPFSAETCFVMGNLAIAENSPQQAAWFYARTLALDPQHRRAMNNLGVLAIQDKRWPQANGLLTRSLELSPRDPKANYLLAQVRIALNDPAGASIAIDNALKAQPERSAYQQLRAEIDRMPRSPAP